MTRWRLTNMDIDELILRFERTDGARMSDLELRNLVRYYQRLARVQDDKRVERTRVRIHLVVKNERLRAVAEAAKECVTALTHEHRDCDDRWSFRRLAAALGWCTASAITSIRASPTCASRSGTEGDPHHESARAALS